MVRGQEAPGKIKPGMPSCSCTPQDTGANDMLAGMMQRVVAAVINATAQV